MSGYTPAHDSDFDPFAGPQILATTPSTEAQREIWTAAQIGPHASLAYNESITLELRGVVDIPRLHEAFQTLVLRHEALRTTFSGDGLTQCVGDGARRDADVRDLLALAPEVQREAVQALVDEDVGTPFDLEQGPLCRVRYLRLAPDLVAVVFTAHHIVCDGWSTAVLLKEWAAVYNTGTSESMQLVAAPQLSDFAAAEFEHKQTEQHARSETYWLNRFSGELPVLDLPYDRARPPYKTYESHRCDHWLSSELTAAVKKVGAKAGASQFTTLLALFEALLFRLSGQEDLVVGIPTAGQTVDGFEGLVGHCVNMLPLRTKLDASVPLSALVASLRSTMLDAFEHQRYTFGTLISKLPMARDVSRSPLISVVFNLDRGLTSDAIGFAGIDATCLTNPRRSENFDLFLNAVELPQGIKLECQYNTALFDEATVRRWLAAYGQLLEAFVADPSVPLGRAAVVSSAERALYNGWNDAGTSELPDPALVHRWIERTAARRADATACSFEGSALSYAELNRRANRLAHRLRALGVERGTLVGICVERSLDLLVALVGVLKAGAAYVPLDPGYPLERLEYMAQDARLVALVAQTALLKELPLQSVQVVLIDDDSTLAQQPTTDLPDGPEAATADDPAYVIYTSGSTGKPKGVLLAHRSVVNLMNSVSKRPGMVESDRVLAVTTFAFDISVSELLLPLAVGAEIVLVSRDVASDGARLLDVVRDQHVTFIDATPATYRLLLGAGWRGDRKLTAICTGEAMPRDLAIQLVDKVRELWNGYGPTETTVWSTFFRVTEPVTRILIGRPIDNTQIHLLDADRQPTMLGVPGEIYIGGLGVGLGYLNRPELTTERFVADPFSAVLGARMYRTGDLGRYLPDGNTECLGRNDHQIKLRGYRIELGEIEDVLAQHEALQQAAVTVREDTPGDARLVGYIVLAAEQKVRDVELRAHLKRSLPDYMVPAIYVRLESMPLTPSGKINRRALPVPTAHVEFDVADFVPPSTPSETLLAELWQEALNVPRVSIHDDFFMLGGHSLLASQILARLKRDHGLALSFRKMFEAPTIARLAVVIDDMGEHADATAGTPLERGDQSVAPLSVVQERLWMLEQLGAESRALVHNLPAAWRFAGVVDATLLQRALDAVAARHSTLRTTFEVVGGKPRQRVATATVLTIVEVDLSLLDAAVREHTLLELITQQTREPFDLEHGPLFRSTLFRLAPDDFVYFTLRHNVIWDGWSFDIFLRDLTAYYAAFLTDTAPELPELPVSFGDAVRYRQKFFQSPEIARQIAWWREQLRGSPLDLSLPTDRPRPTQSSSAGQNYSVHILRAEADALTAVGRASGATLFMVLMAAYTVMLQRWSGQNDILVGAPFRARNRPEFENLIGPFVNTLLLRAQMTPAQTFGDLLMQVRDTTLESLSNEDMPLELLGAELPVLRVLFSYQDARQRPPTLGGIEIQQVHVEAPAAANDLMLWTMETRSELIAVLNYSTELFDTATAQRFLEGYAVLLRGILAEPNARICELPIVAPSELARARAFGEPVRLVAAPTSVSALLAGLVATRADASAVEERGRILSYKGLWELAQAVCVALDAVQLEAVVAIYAPAAPERLALLLGAGLKGVNALVLDPSVPATRNKLLCHAAGAVCVLAPSAVMPPIELELPVFAVTNVVASVRAFAPTEAGHVLAYTFDARSQP
ncbi:MAG: hypothetical protein RL701_2340, partial [Pseudomonadota bacterium]